jgi:hypothetical protein
MLKISQNVEFLNKFSKNFIELIAPSIFAGVNHNPTLTVGF